MKLRAAALSILATVAATPAMAQYWYAPGPHAGPYDRPRPYYAPSPYGYDGIAPYDVTAIVRSANLQPISRPWRTGGTFVVRATNPRGEVVRVTVDAYRGRILTVTLADTAPTAGLAPDQRDGNTAPEYDEDGNLLPPRQVPNAQRPITEPQRPVTEQQRPVTAPKRTAAVTPMRPPMPRPRPADAPTPVSVKPAPDVPQAPTVAPPAPAPETMPQPTETPSGTTGSTSAAPTGSGVSAGSGSSFPPVAPLE